MCQKKNYTQTKDKISSLKLKTFMDRNDVKDPYGFSNYINIYTQIYI